MSMIPNVITIAGSDPSGGAGIQADLKTFAALGAYGMAAMTALTAQNTKGVRGVHMVPPDFLKAQLEAVFEDVRVDAVKIGMAGTAESIAVIADILERLPPIIVLDPVMIAQSGDRLLGDEALSALQTRLIPLATIITPNIPEAQVLAGLPGEENPETLARALAHLGPDVLVKGGHAGGVMAEDVLWHGGGIHRFSVPRIDTNNNHGTGCTLAAAIAAHMAGGMDVPLSVQAAKTYLTGALEHAGRLAVGQGAGPVHHGWKTGSA